MFIFFLPKSKVTTIARQSFNTGPYEKMKTYFFPEIRKLIEPKQYMN